LAARFGAEHADCVLNGSTGCGSEGVFGRALDVAVP
jgi:hypothetical protein